MCVPNLRSVSFFVVAKRRRTDKQSHIFTSENRKILDRLLALREFRYIPLFNEAMKILISIRSLVFTFLKITIKYRPSDENYTGGVSFGLSEL